MRCRPLLDGFFHALPEIHEDGFVEVVELLANAFPGGEQVTDGVAGEFGEDVHKPLSWSSDLDEAAEDFEDVFYVVAVPWLQVLVGFVSKRVLVPGGSGRVETRRKETKMQTRRENPTLRNPPTISHLKYHTHCVPPI
jgi:hypothetical protein